MRAVLAGLLVACLAGAAFLLAVDQAAERTPCVPRDAPGPTEARAMTTPDDGCQFLRLRAQLHLPAALLLADAAALGLALAWRSRWRVVGTVLPLVLLVFLGPVAAFALVWRSSCGPVASYVGDCASPAWTHAPWVALSLVVVAAVLIEGRRPRAPPSGPR